MRLEGKIALITGADVVNTSTVVELDEAAYVTGQVIFVDGGMSVAA